MGVGGGKLLQCIADFRLVSSCKREKYLVLIAGMEAALVGRENESRAKRLILFLRKIASDVLSACTEHLLAACIRKTALHCRSLKIPSRGFSLDFRLSMQYHCNCVLFGLSV
jgi:hypothetical protein